MSTGDRLSAQDALFLYAERRSRPLHVGVLGILDRPGDVEALRRHLAGRLHRFPRLRQRVAFVPYEQDFPLWVDHEAFDLAEHVRSIDLDEPATDAGARQLMAEIMAPPLDRERPLWEMWLFPMTEGRSGVILKVHHCVVDGLAAANLVTTLFDLQPDARPTQPAPWHPAPPPPREALLRDAVLSRVDDLTQLAAHARQWAIDAGSAHAVAARALGFLGKIGSIARGTLIGSSRARFSGSTSGYRRFDGVTLPLATAKAIAHAADCKLNDVALALVARGIGDVLRARGVDTDGATVKAAVPVARRSAAEAGEGGNRVSLMGFDLPVDDAPIDELLRRIGAGTRELKRSEQAGGADTWMAIAAHTPPAIVRLVSATSAHQRTVDVVVTNIAGPPIPLYLMGARVVEGYPFVPLFGTMPLGVAISSYDGCLHLGFNADWAGLPDLDLAVAAVRAAIGELREALAPPPTREVALGPDSALPSRSTSTDHEPPPADEATAAPRETNP